VLRTTPDVKPKGSLVNVPKAASFPIIETEKLLNPAVLAPNKLFFKVSVLLVAPTENAIAGAANKLRTPVNVAVKAAIL
jgi:hypothetical protein